MELDGKIEVEEREFEKKRKLLIPTLQFCGIFFLFYYSVLVIPKFGISSEVFFIDNLGGFFVVAGFLLAIVLTKKYKVDAILLLPSFGTVLAASMFLLQQSFYQQVNHLWLSALIIGIVFSIFFGTPKLNFLLFFLNISVPLVIASQVDYLDFQDIAIKQAILYFSSITSIYLSYSSHRKALEAEQEYRAQEFSLQEAFKKKEASEALLNDTNQLANIGGWSLDLATQKLWWSDQTYRIHELPIGSDVNVAEAINYYAEEARPVITEAVTKGIEFGKGWDLELPFITAKKRRIWVRAVGICHTNPDGSKILRGSFQDITEKKRNEQNLKEARDEALRASAAKSTFLANMSHEIRTPMNGVLGNADLLLNDELNSAQKKIVSTIIKSGESMMQILNDILDFSKIDAGHLSLDPHAFDLREQLNSIYNLYETRASEKGIKIDLEFDNEIPKIVFADSTRIRQILSNLVSNAIKFTQNGLVSLRVKKIGGSGSKCNLRFEVEDSGIGIEKENIEHLFKEFTQADLSTTRKFGGTGLGLAISQRLAKLLGSKIEVNSTFGKGSLFLFDLELKITSEHSKDSSQNSHRIEEEFVNNLRILLVEDNGINLELAKNLLKKFGVVCDTASNGQEAVDIVRMVRFDLIFMDCQMPIMDGYEATKIIRKLELDYQPKIIAMTANAMNGDEEKCRDAGMDDYLTKPISRAKLKKTLVKWQDQCETGKKRELAI